MDYLCILVDILALSTVAKAVYCNDSKITEFEMTDIKISFTVYVSMYELIT